MPEPVQVNKLTCDVNALKQSNDAQIRAAGARYTPILDPKAPNLRISSITDAFEALSFSTAMKSKLTSFHKTVSKEWNDEKQAFGSLFPDAAKSPDTLLKTLEALANSSPSIASIQTDLLKAAFEAITDILEKKQNDLFEKQRAATNDSPERRALDNESHRIRKIQGALDPLGEYIRSTAFACISKNVLLIKGQWGTGKTHLLCDIVNDNQKNGIPLFFALAHRLPPTKPILEQFIAKEKIASDLNALLKFLDSEGKKTNGRAAIIIDALNEGNRKELPLEIENLITAISGYQNLALVISCRTPYEELLLSEDRRGEIPAISHRGFSQIEFSAQKEFFKYYDIPLPEVPLLSDEFSRPLFLKVVCESLKDMTTTKKKSQFGDIASGQVGFTFVLEIFFKNVGKVLEDKFNLPAGFCWKLCKSPNGIAGKMAKELNNLLYRSDCLVVLKDCAPGVDAEELLSSLVTEGLLVEDVEWSRDGNKETVRLPYEKFSDHIIARHLLTAPNIDYTNTRTIRKSFKKKSQLGKVFSVKKHSSTYALPSLAEAIMLEFPQRVSRCVPSTRRELVYYLPKRQQLLDPFAEAFLNGLFWRPKKSFCKQTHRFIGVLLNCKNEQITSKTLDVLFALGTKEDHSCSSEKLFRFLAKMKIADRDLFWTEFIRLRGEEGSIRRVLDWSKIHLPNTRHSKTKERFIRLLALCLTTTNRALRDETTMALFLLGRSDPEGLYKVTLETLEFNDPYVPERMLAASYGAIMANLFSMNARTRKLTSLFVRALIFRLFRRGSSTVNKHALARLYVLGMIEATNHTKTIRLKRDELLSIHAAMKSTKSPIPRRLGGRNKKATEGAKAIYMDFDNYTIGTLVKGRRNYDSDNVEYVKLKRKVAWRVSDLGWTEKRFPMDRYIRDSGWSRDNDPAKIDRYGKKYSWISYFEVMGGLQDIGRLRNDRYEGRMADVDIDPSFPRKPPVPDIQLPRLFEAALGEPSDWIANGGRPNYLPLLQRDNLSGHDGDWILIDGYVEQKAPNDMRTIFTFVDAIFSKEGKRTKLVKRFDNLEYPGNDAIPRPYEEIYTFAGEIPWSKQFASSLRDSAGIAIPRHETIFSRRVKKKFRRKAKTAWIEVCKLFPIEDAQAISLISYENVRDPKQEAFFAAIDKANENVEESQRIGMGDLFHIPTAPPDENGYIYTERFVESAGIKIEIPVQSFSWESYHSKVNDSGHAVVPAPALCEMLGLHRIGDSFDFADRKGKVAATYFCKNEEHETAHLLYLRKDLLEQYLRETNQSLLWFLWGERGIQSRLPDRAEFSELWQEYRHIHKGAVFWSNGKLSYEVA